MPPEPTPLPLIDFLVVLTAQGQANRPLGRMMLPEIPIPGDTLQVDNRTYTTGPRIWRLVGGQLDLAVCVVQTGGPPPIQIARDMPAGKVHA